MSAPSNEAVTGRAATTHSWPQYGDRNAISNSVSASLDVSPFVGKGDAYDSMHPTYPDEAAATLIDAAQRVRRENMPGRDGPLHATDIGADIGKVSEFLARSDLLIDAVESPKAIRTQASSTEGVTQHGGVAEGIGLLNGVYDIAVLAQSWHRTDPERADLKAAWILVPDDALATMWSQMAASIPWVRCLTRITCSGDAHRPNRPPMSGGDFVPMTLAQVAWEDRMTPEGILTLGMIHSSYTRSSEAGHVHTRESLRWCLYEHPRYVLGELIIILYVTLVWPTHL